MARKYKWATPFPLTLEEYHSYIHNAFDDIADKCLPKVKSTFYSFPMHFSYVLDDLEHTQDRASLGGMIHFLTWYNDTMCEKIPFEYDDQNVSVTLSKSQFRGLFEALFAGVVVGVKDAGKSKGKPKVHLKCEWLRSVWSHTDGTDTDELTQWRDLLSNSLHGGSCYVKSRILERLVEVGGYAKTKANINGDVIEWKFLPANPNAKVALKPYIRFGWGEDTVDKIPLHTSQSSAFLSMFLPYGIYLFKVDVTGEAECKPAVLVPDPTNLEYFLSAHRNYFTSVKAESRVGKSLLNAVLPEVVLSASDRLLRVIATQRHGRSLASVVSGFELIVCHTEGIRSSVISHQRFNVNTRLTRKVETYRAYMQGVYVPTELRAHILTNILNDRWSCEGVGALLADTEDHALQIKNLSKRKRYRARPDSFMLICRNIKKEESAMRKKNGHVVKEDEKWTGPDSLHMVYYRTLKRLALSTKTKEMTNKEALVAYAERCAGSLFSVRYVSSGTELLEIIHDYGWMLYDKGAAAFAAKPSNWRRVHDSLCVAVNMFVVKQSRKEEK